MGMKVKQAGDRVIRLAREQSTHFHKTDPRVRFNTDNAFRMGFVEGYELAKKEKKNGNESHS